MRRPVQAAVERLERPVLAVADAHERERAAVARKGELVHDSAAQIAGRTDRFQERPASVER